MGKRKRSKAPATKPAPFGETKSVADRIRERNEQVAKAQEIGRNKRP